MRSTNIVLFLLLLNLSAGVMGAAGVVDVDVGVPSIITNGLYVVLGFVLIYDAFEAFTGRVMS